MDSHFIKIWLQIFEKFKFLSYIFYHIRIVKSKFIVYDHFCISFITIYQLIFLINDFWMWRACYLEVWLVLLRLRLRLHPLLPCTGWIVHQVPHVYCSKLMLCSVLNTLTSSVNKRYVISIFFFNFCFKYLMMCMFV